MLTTNKSVHIDQNSCILYGWKIIQCKATGTSHIRRNIPCQDITEIGYIKSDMQETSYLFTSPTDDVNSEVLKQNKQSTSWANIDDSPRKQSISPHDTSINSFIKQPENTPDASIILMQADGAGSCRLSDIGAKIACDSMINQLSNREYSTDMIYNVQSELKQEADKCGTNFKDYSSTLAGIHIVEDSVDDSGISHTKFTAFQLGDSVMGVWLDKDSSYIQGCSQNRFSEAQSESLPNLIEFFKNAQNLSKASTEVYRGYTDISNDYEVDKRKDVSNVYNVDSLSNIYEVNKRKDVSNVYEVEKRKDCGAGPTTSIESNDEVALIMPPENGEHANETWMTTSKESDKHMRSISCELDNVLGFVLMSDGSASSLYNKKKTCFAPAMKKLFSTISNQTKNNSEKYIKDIIDNFLVKNTSDDCSILMAVRAEKEE